jgi:hypothetical protein
MATALQIAANRRNAQRSTGPRTAEGKKAVRLNALKYGMTAEVIVLPHESAPDYHEIRAALIDSYAPANSHELMLVDQIAAGYWRTIRSRRFETAMFDNQLRTHKRAAGMNQSPDPVRDDEGCAVILQVESPESLKNYFRYDGVISRDYYRAINSLERAQASRRREEDRQERKARQHARDLDRIINHPDPDTIAAHQPQNPGAPEDERQIAATAEVDLIGFDSYYEANPDPQPGTSTRRTPAPRRLTNAEERASS